MRRRQRKINWSEYLGGNKKIFINLKFENSSDTAVLVKLNKKIYKTMHILKKWHGFCFNIKVVISITNI
jgi:hypothetical protein